jgi:hypothetical protein
MTRNRDGSGEGDAPRSKRAARLSDAAFWRPDLPIAIMLRACNKTPIGSRRVARSHTPVVADDGVKRKLLGSLGLRARMAAGGEAVSCEAARAVYSNTSSAAYTVYREDRWQRRSKHTETES